jgi:hypothetical protein
MAVYLKKKHHLLALKTSLGREGRVWVIQLELETNAGGSPTSLATFKLSTDDIGLPRYFEAESMPAFQLPKPLVHQIRDAISKLPVEPSHPLWLHLVKPYGYLGIVPWEDLLLPVLQRPILRLPDFLEPPRERRDTLDVALCCSVPMSEPNFSIVEVLGALARTILSNSPRPRTQIHVFPDAGSFVPLKGIFASETRVSVHDPSGAARFMQSSTGDSTPDSVRSVTSPWLRWMRDAMRGRSLDTVHFVCHGYFSEERASLTVTDNPNGNPYSSSATFLGVPETASFLTQTGAYSFVCTSPPNNYSDSGLRYFVDTMAQTRPGPALFHDCNRDPSFTTLGHAYRFLFSPEPMEPVAGPIFMYCQPSLVDTQLPVHAPQAYASTYVSINEELFSSAASSADSPPLSPDSPPPPSAPAPQAAGPGRKRGKKVGPSTAVPTPPPPAPVPPSSYEPVPNWLASAQRYVEEQAQEVQRREASAARTPNNPQSRMSQLSVSETLSAMQSIIKSFAQSATKISKE